MNFDDIKEQLIERGKVLWDRIQDNSTFISLKDKYENLSPVGQKVATAGAVLFGLFIILYYPMSGFFASGTYIEEFQEKRQVIRDLLSTTRDASQVPFLPSTMNAQGVQDRVQQFLQGLNLLPTQIKGVSSLPASGGMVPQKLIDSSVEVSLSQLNLRQIVDLGHQLQTISQTVKVKDLVMEANQKDGRYFDVVFKLVSLAVPTIPEPAAEPPGKKAPQRPPRPSRGDDSE